MKHAPAVIYSVLTLIAIAVLAGLYFIPPEKIGYDICFSRRVLNFTVPAVELPVRPALCFTAISPEHGSLMRSMCL